MHSLKTICEEKLKNPTAGYREKTPSQKKTQKPKGRFITKCLQTKKPQDALIQNKLRRNTQKCKRRTSRKKPEHKKKPHKPRADSSQNVPKQKTIGRSHSKQIAKKHSIIQMPDIVKRPRTQEETTKTQGSIHHKMSPSKLSQGVRSLTTTWEEKLKNPTAGHREKTPNTKKNTKKKPKGRVITKCPQAKNYRARVLKTIAKNNSKIQTPDMEKNTVGSRTISKGLKLQESIRSALS